MQVSLGTEDVAALFALIEEPPPPGVAHVLYGDRHLGPARALPEVQAQLMRSGLMAEGRDGLPVLSPDVAELLAICHDATEAITVERDGAIGESAYFSDEKTTVVSCEGALTTLARIAGDEGRSAWFAESLGEAVVDEDGACFGFPMPADDLERLLALSSRKDEAAIERFCRDRSWPRDLLDPHLRVLQASGPTTRATAIRSHRSGMATTTFALSPGGAWCVKLVLDEQSSVAKLTWRSRIRLLGFARDFEDDWA